LADPKSDLLEDLPDEILIGGESYWKVKDNSPIRLSVSMVLIPTIFGWVLSGSRFGARVISTVVNFVHSDRPYLPTDDELRRFRVLEAIGITTGPDRANSAKDSALLEAFHASFRIQDQRRVVSLPKKQGVVLPNNRMNAARRLSKLRERHDNNEALKEIYYVEMLVCIAKGQVELAPWKTRQRRFTYLIRR
jgi:hypothetical protein